MNAPLFFSKTFSDPVIFWNMLEAIGTISATILALYFGYRSISEERRNRPDIELLHDLPDLTIIEDDFIQFMLKIRNNGPITAKNVKIRALEINQNSNNLLRPVDIHMLFETESIQNGDFSNFNLFLLPEEGGVHVFYLTHRDMRTLLGKKSYERKDTYIKLLITGDNFPAKTISYKLVNILNSERITLQKM